MKDTVTRVKEKHEAEAKKMLRECSIICGTIIVLMVVIIVAGVRLQSVTYKDQTRIEITILKRRLIENENLHRLPSVPDTQQ
jgi:hypothetical protein